jgi:hypothetical protein
VSTCLACRRELERLTTVQRYVTGMPRVEPGPDFAAQFWQRMDPEPVPTRAPGRPPRPIRWALPALAAAAVLAVALQFMVTTPTAPTRPAPQTRSLAQARPAPKPEVAAAPPRQEPAEQVVNVDNLRLEDLPPELREHPELFLRLPVVRRLETLEHFDAVRQEQGDEDGAG